MCSGGCADRRNPECPLVLILSVCRACSQQSAPHRHAARACRGVRPWILFSERRAETCPRRLWPRGDVPRGGQLCWEATGSSRMVHERVLPGPPTAAAGDQVSALHRIDGHRAWSQPHLAGRSQAFPFLPHSSSCHANSLDEDNLEGEKSSLPTGDAVPGMHRHGIISGSHFCHSKFKKLRRDDNNIKCPAPHRRCCTRRALMRASRCCPSATGPPSRPSIRQAQSTICIELQLLATLLS